MRAFSAARPVSPDDSHKYWYCSQKATAAALEGSTVCLGSSIRREAPDTPERKRPETVKTNAGPFTSGPFLGSGAGAEPRASDSGGCGSKVTRRAVEPWEWPPPLLGWRVGRASVSVAAPICIRLRRGGVAAHHCVLQQPNTAGACREFHFFVAVQLTGVAILGAHVPCSISIETEAAAVTTRTQRLASTLSFNGYQVQKLRRPRAKCSRESRVHSSKGGRGTHASSTPQATKGRSSTIRKPSSRRVNRGGLGSPTSSLSGAIRAR